MTENECKDPSLIFSYKTWKLISDEAEQNLAGRVIFQTSSHKNRMINCISNPIINNRMILFPKSTGFMRLFEISQWNLYQITVLPHVLHTYASLLGMQFI